MIPVVHKTVGCPYTVTVPQSEKVCAQVRAALAVGVPAVLTASERAEHHSHPSEGKFVKSGAGGKPGFQTKSEGHGVRRQPIPPWPLTSEGQG